jgi:hypothetical protein
MKKLSLGVLALAIGLFGSPLAQAAPPHKNLGSIQQIVLEDDTVLPLQIDDLIFENGQLLAVGELGGTEFKTPVTLTAVDNGGLCPLLDLRLGPIELDLLGLRVVTSPICLLIAAEPGEGNLLGNLLCSVAGLLDGGLSLEDILGNLPLVDQVAVVQGLVDLINAALDEILAPESIAGVSGTGDRPARGNGAGQGQGGGRNNAPGQANRPPTGRECDILNLSLGPVELNLLGLVVNLDDCNDGPVTVDITARPGPGRLLGNLLCSLAGLFDSGLDLSNPGVIALVNQIVDEITAILSRSN